MFRAAFTQSSAISKALSIASSKTLGARYFSKVQGTVKWFDPKKGYGFIAQNNGQGDLFVHNRDIVAEGFRSLAG